MTLTKSLAKVVILGLTVLSCSERIKAQKLPSSAFQSYLKDNLKYPDVALTNQVSNMLYYKATVYENATIRKFEPIDKLPMGIDNIQLVEVFATGDQYVPRSSAYDKEFNELVMATAKQYELYEATT